MYRRRHGASLVEPSFALRRLLMNAAVITAHRAGPESSPAVGGPPAFHDSGSAMRNGMVGDDMQALRSYLVRTVSPGPSSAVSDLPPLWSSVLHADADF